MDANLDDLLLEWEDRRDRGDSVSASDLCSGQPSLTLELGRCIKLLEECEPLFEFQSESSTVPTVIPRRLGQFEIRAVIGKGGVGIVYEGWDTALSRKVAIKMLCPEGIAGISGLWNRLVRRFVQEAQILAQLKHPSIVPIYEFAIHEGQPFFVMECETGGSLTQRLPEFTAAGPQVIVPFLAKVAGAVHFAHTKGVLHRDLKPANILLTDDRNVRDVAPLVGDFGLAKLLDVDSRADTVMCDETPLDDWRGTHGESSQLTGIGQRPGTPAYMAPEQLQSEVPDSNVPTIDVWALGVILYETLMGAKPFQASTRSELCDAILTATPKLDKRADRHLRRIVERCLKKEPSKRYPNVEALQTDLLRWRPHRRLRRCLVAVAGLASLTVVGFIWASTSDFARDWWRTQSNLGHLRRDGRIDLVPRRDGDASWYPIRLGTAGTKVVSHLECLRIESNTDCCLVEIMKQVPAKRYRLIARVCLDRPLAPDGYCGVYFNHADVSTALGSQHCFYVVHFSDTVRKRARLGAPDVAVFTPHFDAKLCSDTPSEVTGITRNRNRPILLTAPRIEYDRDASGAAPDYTIEVVVDGLSISGQIGFADKNQPSIPFPNVPNKLSATTYSLLTKSYSDLADVSPSELQGGSGAGIFVSHAVCSVRQFRIEELRD